MDRKVETTIREIMASGCDNGIKPCHPLTHSEIQKCITDKNIAPLVTRMANLFDTIHKFGDGQMDGDWYSRVTIAAAELELYMIEFHLLTLGIGPPDRLKLFEEWLKDCEERPNEVLGWGVEPRTMIGCFHDEIYLRPFDVTDEGEVVYLDDDDDDDDEDGDGTDDK